MDVDHELAARYRALADPALLALAQDYDALTDEAQTALRAEFAQRGIEPPLLDEPEDETDQTEERRLVTIRRFRDLSEAIVARGFLESNGITVFLQDENLVRLDWQVSNFIGGLRLQVEASNQQRAVALLDGPVPEQIEFDGPSEKASGEPASFHQPHCPVCHSLDIDFQGTGRKAAIASLYVFAIPLPTGPESWLCNHCGARWQADEDDQPASA